MRMVRTSLHASLEAAPRGAPQTDAAISGAHQFVLFRDIRGLLRVALHSIAVGRLRSLHGDVLATRARICSPDIVQSAI